MKPTIMQNILRGLVTLVGAGLGLAITLGGTQLFRYTHPNDILPLVEVILLYVGAALLGGIIFFAISHHLVSWGEKRLGEILNFVDHMPAGQLLSSSIGLILGLIVAALLTRILTFMGDSMLTTAISAILFIVFGTVGYTIAWRKANDFVRLIKQLRGGSGRTFKKARHHSSLRKQEQQFSVPAKILDASSLIDGRIVEVCRLGFLEGELIVPEFVVTELQHLADSTDNQKRLKGRRGLDMLAKMQATLKQPIRLDETNYSDTEDVDVKLLRLVRENKAIVVTGDYNLNKVASVIGVPVLNLNELAGVLRPVVHTGDELTVTIVKEGKENGQGIAYMEDGTMMVVDGGRNALGETVQVLVTSALQTNAGRMIFAKRKESE